MEAAPVYRQSSEQSPSPQRTIGRRKFPKKSFSNLPWQSPNCSPESFGPFPNLHDGLLRSPLLPHPLPFLSHSFPPFPPHQKQQQPPLLPLPNISKSHSINITDLSRSSRGLSCPPSRTRSNSNLSSARCRDSSLTPKKKSTKSSFTGKEEKLSVTKSRKPEISPKEVSVDPSGPEPEDLPKDVSRVLSAWSGIDGAAVNFKDARGTDEAVINQPVDIKLSGSMVFTLSPPPSSLPLPTFQLRPKLSCTAEAAGAGVDPGATDNLRRLLRLR